MDVVVDACEYISDVYEEILKEEQNGNVIIHRYDEIDIEEQKMHANYIKEHIDDAMYAAYKDFLVTHFSKLWD